MNKIKKWIELKDIIKNNFLNKLSRTTFENNRYLIHKFLLKKKKLSYVII